MPLELRQAIADAKSNKPSAKKLLVLINPPYGESANSLGNEAKAGIANTSLATSMGDLGYASRELFVQFLVRVKREMPNATIAMFSTLKYVNAPNFEKFREHWKAKYLGGFVVHSKAFDGLSGNFPIGFLVWDSATAATLDSITTRVHDKDSKALGNKVFYNIPNSSFLSEWMPRLRKNKTDVVPLINAVTPTKKTDHVRNTNWSDGAVGHFFCNGNDLQNSGTMTAVFSSAHSIGHAGGYFITSENLWQAAIVFTVRMVIPHTWINHNDQFLKPSAALSDEFKIDCLIYMLFAGKNLSAGANDLEWNDRKWSLVNHFIPFAEHEVAARERFESNFMSAYLVDKALSPEAARVMQEGKKLWRQYHATQFEKKIRDEFKLNRPDVGWYQIRKALEANADNEAVDFVPFKEAYDALSAKLRPQVYSLGFLKQ